MLYFFRRERFIYTLTPGTYQDANALDEFLFERREGFCEHYAAAFPKLSAMGVERVCVYCASSHRADPAYAEDAYRLGQILAGAGITHAIDEGEADDGMLERAGAAVPAGEVLTRDLADAVLGEIVAATTKDSFAPIQSRVQAWVDVMQNARAA